MVTPAVEGIDLFKIAGRSMQNTRDEGGTVREQVHSKGVLQFPSHDKRKTNAPMTGVRWAMHETIWKVVAGERK